MTRQEILNSLSRRELTETLADRLYDDRVNDMEVVDDDSEIDVDSFYEELDEINEEITAHIRVIIED